MNKLFRQFFEDSQELLVTLPCEKSVKCMAAIMATFGILGASVGIPFSGDIAYYIMLVICWTYMVYKGGLKVSGPFIAFYCVIFLNILITDIPPFFRPFQRGIMFVLVTMVCSSALETKLSLIFRTYLFRYLMYGIVIVGVGSFFCYFLGINMMENRWDSDNSFERYSNFGGTFGGLAAHSMMLGPMAMISALFFYFIYQKKTDKIYLLLFFLSTMSVVLSASRAALLALLVAIVYNLIMGKVNAVVKKRMIQILAVSAIFTIPLYGVVFKGIIDKQERREQSGGSNSRDDKITYRLNEFKSSPIFGVGFCSIDINGGDEYSEKEGRIEPGSSHLSVLSMLGLAGFIVYMVILYKVYTMTKRVPTHRSRFVFTCFVGFFVHASVEGYILSAGGFLALMFWLIVGQCTDVPILTKVIDRRKHISV